MLAVKNVRAQRGRLAIERLPAYAPELNPVEYISGYWKHHELPNFCPRDFGQLSYQARRALRRMPGARAWCGRSGGKQSCHYDMQVSISRPRVRIHLAPPSSPSVFGHLGESLEIRACSCDLRSCV